jgi:C4-dicarboxylate-specific signal transduction histidine kinase
MDNTSLTIDDRDARLAHELANLLDGSLRNVGLALSDLRHVSGEAIHHIDDAVVGRLNAANQAMRQMASLLRQWQSHAKTPDRPHTQQHALDQAVELAVQLIRPAADAHAIELRVTIADDAAVLPSASLQAVIINVLRNSIEACAAASNAPRRIDLDVRLDDDQLMLTTVDTGCGIEPALLDNRGCAIAGQTTRPDGHGIGLAVVRDIAADLGGTAELHNQLPCGARFILRCPVASLIHHGTEA